MLIEALLAAQLSAGCQFPAPAYVQVQTLLQISEVGHDRPEAVATTRITVPRDWPGAQNLYSEGPQARAAFDCLVPDLTSRGGVVGPPQVLSLGPQIQIVSVAQRAPRTTDPIGGRFGGPSDGVLGLWEIKEKDERWQVRLLPPLPTGLRNAQWTQVTLRAPDAQIGAVSPTPTDVGPVHVFNWRGISQPKVTADLTLSPRTAFQADVGHLNLAVYAVGRLIAFTLPYALLAWLLLSLIRRPVSGTETGERRAALLATRVVAFIFLLQAARLFDPNDAATKIQIITGAIDIVSAIDLSLLAVALPLAAWPVTRDRAPWARASLRAGFVMVAATCATAAWVALFTPPDDRIRTMANVIAAGLLIGLSWAAAVRATRISEGRLPELVRWLLAVVIPAAGALVALLLWTYRRTADLQPQKLVYAFVDLFWPLVLLLLLVLLRMHARHTVDLAGRSRWLIVFVFAIGLIRWPHYYALVPFPLAELVGLAVLPLLLRLTRHRVLDVPESSRRRLATIVRECRDLENREEKLRRRWASGDLRDADYQAENAGVQERIRVLRAEIGLDPAREDGLSALDLALSRGPGASWWGNARLAARYSAAVGVPAAAFLIWATWRTDDLGRGGWIERLATEPATLAADLVAALLIWPIAGFVLGALWRELPGRRGYLKPVVPVLAYAAGTGAHGILNNLLDQAPVRGSVVRILLLFLVLTVVAVLMDARTLQTRPGSWTYRLAPLAAVYRLGTAGSGIALIVAQAAALVGLWSQLRSGIQITSQVEPIAPISESPPPPPPTAAQ
ncbi:hypothetical protein J5X84_05675 [Streptosporangiaceae bacterium NEAU-GS5]|nr:hypothetical protein [Streptosporangiaceae bacterium NEAU-GS5]